MAEIIQDEGGKKKGKKHRPKKHSTHIDMTPMVDLACLLITFFMLTTAFSKPKVMEIILPEKDRNEKDKPKGPEIVASRTLHILISGEDKVYYYVGIADPNKPPLPTVIKSDFSKDGIRKVLLDRNLELYKKVDETSLKVVKGELKISQDSLKNVIKKLKTEDKVGPIVLIKADEKAKYRNIVDVIDEMAITSIARYAIVDISPVEIEMIKNAK